MYNKSKNRVLFAIFIIVILLIIFVLVLSVYNSKSNIDVEEYKISLNNILYDEEYSYISLERDAVLKKEWDGNYYLYEANNSKKHQLGTETVFYDKTKKQIMIYGDVYQVFKDAETVKKTGKTVVNDLTEFQFFKLNDRKYLIIGSEIGNGEFSTLNYLMVSIDKAGNATLLNDNVNIKTINPLIFTVSTAKFDIANEKLIIEENEVDLKKINGSTNEYVVKEEEKDDSNVNINAGTNNNSSTNNNTSTNSGPSSQVYNEIINQIINISGLITNVANKTNLYKNISLRSVYEGASYLDITYSIIDPENKYLSVFLSLEDEFGDIKFYYLSKDDTSYRISGLQPNKQYTLSINYISRGNSSSIVADSIIVVTNTDPTLVRITKMSGEEPKSINYKIKMYNEYEFAQGNVALTNCEDQIIAQNVLNIQNALSSEGELGQFVLDSSYTNDYICLVLTSVKDVNGNDIIIKSYHKVKNN